MKPELVKKFQKQLEDVNKHLAFDHLTVLEKSMYKGIKNEIEIILESSVKPVPKAKLRNGFLGNHKRYTSSFVKM